MGAYRPGNSTYRYDLDVGALFDVADFLEAPHRLGLEGESYFAYEDRECRVAIEPYLISFSCVAQDEEVPGWETFLSGLDLVRDVGDAGWENVTDAQDLVIESAGREVDKIVVQWESNPQNQDDVIPDRIGYCPGGSNSPPGNCIWFPVDPDQGCDETQDLGEDCLYFLPPAPTDWIDIPRDEQETHRPICGYPGVELPEYVRIWNPTDGRYDRHNVPGPIQCIPVPPIPI